MKLIFVMMFISISLSCRSPSQGYSVPRNPVENKDHGVTEIRTPPIDSVPPSGEQRGVQVEDVVKEIPKAEEDIKVDPKADGIDKETLTADNYGTGVGNGTFAYENVNCGIIRRVADSFVLFNWQEKPLFELQLSPDQLLLVPSESLRACVRHNEMDIVSSEEASKLKTLMLLTLYPTEEGQLYDFEVLNFSNNIEQCAKVLSDAGFFVDSKVESAFGIGRARVTLLDIQSETLDKYSCVRVKRFIGKKSK